MAFSCTSTLPFCLRSLCFSPCVLVSLPGKAQAKFKSIRLSVNPLCVRSRTVCLLHSSTLCTMNSVWVSQPSVSAPQVINVSPLPYLPAESHAQNTTPQHFMTPISPFADPTCLMPSAAPYWLGCVTARRKKLCEPGLSLHKGKKKLQNENDFIINFRTRRRDFYPV